MTSVPVYCLCRQPYDENHFMIQCDLCQDWFHGNCVGIEEEKADDIDIYHCPNCEILQGPSIMKKQHGCSQEIKGLEREPVKTGSSMFIHQLQSKSFDSSDEVILNPTGSQLTVEFLEERSFSIPILVLKKEGLGMKLPPTSFTVRDVEKYVGSHKEVDAIDVASQTSCKMTLGEFVKYYYSGKREKVFNIIRLEFSKTMLSNIVEMPKIVRRLSWVENLWPEESGFERPNLQKCCFMSVQESYTDFHIEFGAPSIWYHVLKGEKIFYLICPTNANLTLFECWSNSPKQKEMFFGDHVDKCYKCSVKQGQTLFIPAGWMYAVMTPVDCLAFGGKFLHSLNIEMQLKVYEIQRQLCTPDLFVFPRFETLCWHVGKQILEILGGLREKERCPATYLIRGCKALKMAFQAWTRKEVLPDHEDKIPKTVQTTQLIDDLAREISLVEDVFQRKNQKTNTICEVQQHFLANSCSLNSTTKSTSECKLLVKLPFKCGTRQKRQKHKDNYPKAKQKGKVNPELQSDDADICNAMDLNHQGVKAVSFQKGEFNTTSICDNNSHDYSNPDKVFDGNESDLISKDSIKKGKSLSKSLRSKVTKKKGNSRLVVEHGMGDKFDLNLSEKLQIEETLCKEQASQMLGPTFPPNLLQGKFGLEKNLILDRRENVVTSENLKIDEELVEGIEDKTMNGNVSDRIQDPLKDRNLVENPHLDVLSNVPASSCTRENMQDNVFMADSQSSSTSCALYSLQHGQSNGKDQRFERSGSGLGTESTSSVSKRTALKWPIKRLVYTRIQGTLDTTLMDGESSYLLLESDQDDEDEDDDARVLRSLPKEQSMEF